MTAMRITLLYTILIFLSFQAMAAKGIRDMSVYTFSKPGQNVTLYPEALPCNPADFGTHCIINPKPMPKKQYKVPIYCGDTLVYVTKAQRKVLNAYLRENRNMVLRYKVDGEFIDAPCF